MRNCKECIYDMCIIQGGVHFFISCLWRTFLVFPAFYFT